MRATLRYRRPCFVYDQSECSLSIGLSLSMMYLPASHAFLSMALETAVNVYKTLGRPIASYSRWANSINLVNILFDPVLGIHPEYAGYNGMVPSIDRQNTIFAACSCQRDVSCSEGTVLLFPPGETIKQADAVLLGFPLEISFGNMTPQVRLNDLMYYECVAC